MDYMKNKEIQKPKCSKCGSGQVYLRLRAKEFICRQCGATTFFIEIQEKEKSNETKTN